jgi:hypothetical protein
MVVAAALVVLVALIALAWLVVMRRLKDDGLPVRTSLEEDETVREWPAEREPEQEYAPGRGLERSKDRDVARTWDPGL